MIEILTILSLIQFNNTPVQEVFDQNLQLKIDTNTQYILNNTLISDQQLHNLQLGSNHLSIIKQGKLQDQLLIITHTDPCDYNNIFISEFNYHANSLQINLPENCQQNIDHLSLYVDHKIQIPTPAHNIININTNLVSTSESIILKYKDKIIDSACWLNTQINQTELQDFQKFQINTNDCLRAKSDASYFQRPRAQEQFTEITPHEHKHTPASPKTKTTLTTKQAQLPKQPQDNNKATVSKKTPTPHASIEQGNIQIHAVMANSQEEYLILKNHSQKNLNLNKSYLTDKTNTKHILADIPIAAQEEIKISKLKFQINNSDEILTLFNPNNKQIDSFTIKQSSKETLLHKTPPQAPEIVTQKTTPATQNPHNTNTPDTTLNHTTQNAKHDHSSLHQNKSNTNSSDTTNKKIRLSEIFANPKGPDKGNEYIEIFNPHNHPLQLEDFSIQINNKTYPLTGTILAQEYLTLTHLNVTNTNCQIVVLHNSEQVDKFSYNQATEDHSWIKINNSWYQTKSISPKQENGTLKNYQGTAEVINATLIFADQQIPLSSHTLIDGIYEHINIDYLQNTTTKEILKINEHQLTPSHTTNQTPSKTITSSMGLLSMASLGILYSLFK